VDHQHVDAQGPSPASELPLLHPVLRDPDNLVYGPRGNLAGMLLGGYEPESRPRRWIDRRALGSFG